MVIGLAAGALFLGNPVRAQTPADLAAGRQLFGEALADEEHGRFAEALLKYKRVQAIRDTANVRYRIGSSLEHLGKIAQAVDAYAAAVRIGTEGRSGPTSGADAEMVRAAQARLDALGPKVAHVALRLPSPAPADAEITVDGEPVPPQALADLPVDPGSHVVAATAKGARPFRAQINLPEGARVEVAILLEAIVVEPPPPPPPAEGPPYKTIGIVTGAAGGVLLIGGVIVLALRSSAIGKLKDACPGGNCPADREQDLTATRDRAKIEGPVAIALLATGAAALGTGIALFALSNPRPRATTAATRLVPVPITNGAMLTFARAF